MKASWIDDKDYWCEVCGAHNGVILLDATDESLCELEDVRLYICRKCLQQASFALPKSRIRPKLVSLEAQLAMPPCPICNGTGVIRPKE